MLCAYRVNILLAFEDHHKFICQRTSIRSPNDIHVSSIYNKHNLDSNQKKLISNFSSVRILFLKVILSHWRGSKKTPIFLYMHIVSDHKKVVWQSPEYRTKHLTFLNRESFKCIISIEKSVQFISLTILLWARYSIFS